MLAGEEIGFGERAAEAGVGAGVAVDFACGEGSEGICCGRASGVPPSLDGLEREADGTSPLVGWRQARAASSSMRPLSSPASAGEASERADDLKA